MALNPDKGAADKHSGPSMTTSDTIYSVIGVIGSLITAFAILPLIFRVVSRQSSAEISYAYQVSNMFDAPVRVLFSGVRCLEASAKLCSMVENNQK